MGSRKGQLTLVFVCHRGLYKRSVINFKEEKYQLELDNYADLVISSDGKYYICKTCDKKLLKVEIPCQSVKNQLELDDLPDYLQNK